MRRSTEAHDAGKQRPKCGRPRTRCWADAGFEWYTSYVAQATAALARLRDAQRTMEQTASISLTANSYRQISRPASRPAQTFVRPTAATAQPKAGPRVSHSRDRSTRRGSRAARRDALAPAGLARGSIVRQATFVHVFVSAGHTPWNRGHGMSGETRGMVQ